MLDVLFGQVLSCSFIGSYVIVAVLVARLFLKNSPRIYSYALWSVVFFRLVVPFALESPFAILPVTPESPFGILPVTLESPFGILPETQDILPMNQVASTMSQEKTENHVSTTVSPEAPFSSMEVQDSDQNSTSVWSILWCMGMSILAIPSLCSTVKLHKQLRVSVRLERNIYLVDSIDTPFVWGLLKPKIYLPSTLNEEEKKCVIPHEEYHLKRFDHITRILAFFTLMLHWFNPLVWCAFVLSGRDMELSVDEKVIKNLVLESPTGENESTIKKKYATLLLELGTKKNFFVPLYVTPTFRHGETKERVNHVMKMKKTKLWVSGLAGVLVIGLIVGFATSKTTLKYDTAYAEMVLDGFIQSKYLGNSLDSYVDGVAEGNIDEHASLINWECQYFLLHGLLPESVQLESGLLDIMTYRDDISFLGFDAEVYGLATELLDYYSTQIQYTILDSWEGESRIYPPNFFISEHLHTKKELGVPLILGFVSMEIQPIIVAQEMTREALDEIWKEQEESGLSDADLRNGYLLEVLTLLLENIENGNSVVYGETVIFIQSMIHSWEYSTNQKFYALERCRIADFDTMEEWAEENTSDWDLERTLFDFTVG